MVLEWEEEGEEGEGMQEEEWGERVEAGGRGYWCWSGTSIRAPSLDDTLLREEGP